jgi:hypothetical protein
MHLWGCAGTDLDQRLEQEGSDAAIVSASHEPSIRPLPRTGNVAGGILLPLSSYFRGSVLIVL